MRIPVKHIHWLKYICWKWLLNWVIYIIRYTYTISFFVMIPQCVAVFSSFRKYVLLLICLALAERICNHNLRLFFVSRCICTKFIVADSSTHLNIITIEAAFYARLRNTRHWNCIIGFPMRHNISSRLTRVQWSDVLNWRRWYIPYTSIH